MNGFLESFLLMFVLLNPFSMSVYLIEIVRATDAGLFARLLLRAALISLAVFLSFAWLGDTIFTDVLQVRFLAFLIFGGITFLLVGIRLILALGPPVETLRPASEQVSGSIAMPFIVGPGTISSSVLAGSRLPPLQAGLSILLALAAFVAAILVFKQLHDWVRQRNERLIRRYTDIAGRVTALFTGTFAVDMILTGLERWLEQI